MIDWTMFFSVLAALIVFYISGFLLAFVLAVIAINAKDACSQAEKQKISRSPIPPKGRISTERQQQRKVVLPSSGLSTDPKANMGLDDEINLSSYPD